MQKQRKEYDAKELGPADVKLILLGDSAAGKSKMVERFLMSNYEERQLSTYALTMYRYETEHNNKKYKVDIWDTAGQDCFDNLHTSYYYQANACILVFDITRKLTYQHLKKWYSELRVHCPHIPVILVANKIDVDPSVTQKQFKFAQDNQIPLYYVSAADGTNIVKLFNDALHFGIENKLNPQEGTSDKLLKDVMDCLEDDLDF